ncbi:P1 family peptidase [Paractinoplanes atraurantiacus]|uniref:L-aminopeptidase/D-esterase n=1 Tax=Paractinoplanes atraurantiacus TaxID=1036182 RepID=A0A285IGB4_9ACTN|nr:P1 family peptidase [Actinoplanes atraurantiacus]SNY46126.1 L-aminopeptidase/D-esterase [Actinoplanes atraurantiacus]
MQLKIGHWTGDGTGVTVIVPPPGTIASGEVRGGAPATREFALLDPARLVDRVDAVVLSGGSALGLAAGDGVARALWEEGVGFPTPFGAVPIVVGMSIFDASVSGTPPTAADGRAALKAATSDLVEGRIGAGTGATVGKWRGGFSPGGLGMAHGTTGEASVLVIAVVNAWGDVIAPNGDVLNPAPDPSSPPVPRLGMTNTTLAVVATDARLTKTDCFLLAQSGHTGYARALHPAHSRYDGDAVVALSTGKKDTDLDLLRATATEVTAEAIRRALPTT